MRFEWDSLPPLPRPLSGQSAGISHGALLIAGGTDFPTPLFEGGTKTWFDTIYVLEPDVTHANAAPPAWQPQGTLPRPLAYAASGTIANRLIVAGGSDATRHHADTFALEWIEGQIRQHTLPPLPYPIAMAGAAVLDRTLLVVGGITRPEDTQALRSVWALDLAPASESESESASTSPTWRSLPPLPGDGRILPVVAVQEGRLHVISGAALAPGPDGKATRTYLTDGHAWSPATGWQPLPPVPHPVVAAPAIAWGPSHIFVLGGDDGVLAPRVAELKASHPGFGREVLAYHTITRTWTPAGTFGTLPAGLVTTQAVKLGESVVLPGGEDRPGHRSAAVLRGRLVPTGRAFFTLDYIVLAAYFIPLLLIGRHFSSTNASTEEFFLGGRRVPWWAAGLSIYGTQLSAITFLAIPAKAYAEDWVFFLANSCILLMAPLVVYFYLPFFRGLNLTSAYEYLEHRFDVVVRLVASLSFVLLQVARMAIVVFLPSLTLAAVTGIDVYVSILLMGILCTLYTYEGGMHAVVWTDVMQVIVLLGAAVVSLIVIVMAIDGGLPTIWHVARAHAKLHMFNWSWSAATTTVWVVVIGNFLANMVPYTADQAVVQRYFTTPDERQAARAVWTSALLTLPTSVIFFGVGTALFAFYRLHPEALNPSVATDATFSWFIARQLPTGIAGLAVAGVFAAAMSTLSGSINSIVTAVSVDVQQRFWPGMPDVKRLRLARWLTGIVGAIGTASALLMATWNVGSLWDIFLRALGLFGGGLAGVFALGIFSTRANARGALGGLLASAVVLFFVQRTNAVHFFLFAGIGIATCMIAGYLISLVTGAPARSLDGLTVYTRRSAVARRAAAAGTTAALCVAWFAVTASAAQASPGTTVPEQIASRQSASGQTGAEQTAANEAGPRQTDVYVAGQDEYHTYRIPSLIVTTKGTLLAFAEGRRAGASDAGDIDLVLKRSVDAGATWSALQIVGDNGPNTFGNPCPVIDRRTGVIWLLTTQNLGTDREKDILAGTSAGSRTVWVLSSKDDGVTWSAPVEITRQVKRPDWTWYATGPGVGIQTRDGRLVIPANHAEAKTGVHRSHLFVSRDRGKSWTLGASSDAGTNESQVVELADGRLMLNMRNHPPRTPENHRLVAVSRDGGRTLSPASEDPSLVEPPAQASLLRLTTAKAQDADRLLFANPASAKRERMTVRVSRDEGVTWPQARVLHEGPAAYSSLAVLPDWTIGLLYERGATSAYETVTFARFTLDWLTEGRDRLAPRGRRTR